MSELRFVQLEEWMAEALAEIERLCFPLADPAELLDADALRAYSRVFPEGVFVAMDGDVPVGMGAGIFLDFDFDHPQHSIVEITGEHQCGNHDPAGEWYYGTDITVHPQQRRRGIGQRLYELRKDLVVRHGKRGIIAGGSIPGYFDHKNAMTAHDYVEKVVAGELYDPTLSFQLGNGFEVRGLLENYLADEADDGWATLIVWEA